MYVCVTTFKAFTIILDDPLSDRVSSLVLHRRICERPTVQAFEAQTMPFPRLLRTCVEACRISQVSSFVETANIFIEGSAF